MNTDPSSESDLLSRLGALTSGCMGVQYLEFERILREGDSSIPLTSLHQVLNLACDQLGFWQAEWLFSPADTPNTVAKTEMEGWQIMWRGIFDTLVENVPGTKDSLEREQNLKLLQHSLQRGVEYNQTRPVRKIAAAIFSQVSFALNKVGLASSARGLYEWCLYPKGTVARP
ncbi:MAG: hypothetical protein CVU57_09950 [Deltaproteobacteria bacterium HGW-Deltaproteobacteria-15]|jgi:hypothetical protein|nr:MAG: hypothetical protein CVU57_09950 [Deltaproteobacteria bacterium HGW-Deltaproteobacteria-15]